MKKLLLIGLAITGISGVAYASYGDDCKGASRFIENLDLDEARAYEVDQILGSFKQVREFAMSGQHEQIPVFIEERKTELAEVLTEGEMEQFKENIGDWADSKDFSKFSKFSGMNFGKNKE